MILFVAVVLIAVAARNPACASDEELLLQLNKDLLYSTAPADSLPNPSVHIALRLSTHHNLLRESQHLHQLKTRLQHDIEKSISNIQPVVGRLALYVLALQASCQNLNFSLSVNELNKPLLTHLKMQLLKEKQEITSNHKPKTSYYQYSLGILALCVSGVRVDLHVSHKLIHAVQHHQIKHGDSLCIDTHAVAGMALQCLNDSGTSVSDHAELDKALATIKHTLLGSVRADGHMGNEYSTGLAIQALLAMGGVMEEYSSSVEALKSHARKGSYHNPMAISQTLPALQQRSYLDLKSMACKGEDDSLIWDPPPRPKPEEKATVRVDVKVEAVALTTSTSDFVVDVPSGSSLLTALTLLQEKSSFTFEKEDSLWGPFLSRVNGEWARQSDRRYWQISSNGKALSQGMGDYKVDSPQKITIKNVGY